MAVTKIREPRQQRSIEKKNKIIEVGFGLMCDQGYHRTTTTDIAKAAGVSTGIIYSYFEDKHDIFVEGLRLFVKKMVQPIYDLFAQYSGVPLPERLDEMTLRQHLAQITDSIVEGHQVFQNAHREIDALSNTSEDVSKIMIDFEIQITEDLETFLRRVGFDSPELPEKTHIIYNLVENLSHELIFHHHPGLDGERMRKIVEDTVIWLLLEAQ